MEVKIGRVTMALITRQGTGPIVEVTAQPAPTDRVPLILGFRDVLSEHVLHADYCSRTAWLARQVVEGEDGESA